MLGDGHGSVFYVRFWDVSRDDFTSVFRELVVIAPKDFLLFFLTSVAKVGIEPGVFYIGG
jgi:hypothetical protein